MGKCHVILARCTNMYVPTMTREVYKPTPIENLMKEVNTCLCEEYKNMGCNIIPFPKVV